MPDAVVEIQQSVGNRAFARSLAGPPRPVLARQKLPTAPVADPVKFVEFKTSGTSLGGQALGPSGQLLWHMNAVEIVFDVSQAKGEWTDFKVKQWSGPEGWHLMRDLGKWETVTKGPGTGADNAMPENIVRKGDLIGQYDSPGPSLQQTLAGKNRRKAIRVYSCQNFTTWVEGRFKKGGGVERLCPVVSWHSIMNLYDQAILEPDAVPKFARADDSAAGTGWRPVEPPS